ncbi:MAG: hypothetical protein D9V47_10345 [Clostridia bacterium]|nr:MAG: hypothetical protein D9V47_10345 [Clostridia bacterium]
MTPNQIRQAGMQALAKTLGPVGMVRFIQQFDTGKGDYTRERGQWLGDLTIEQIVKEAGEAGRPT